MAKLAPRAPALGDVEPGHDLETGRDLHRELHGGARDLGQHAVLAQTDAVILLVGLEMNIGSTFPDGVDQHLVDEPHDRGVVCAGGGVVGVFLFFLARVEIQVV